MAAPAVPLPPSDVELIEPFYGGPPVNNFVPPWALAVSDDVRVIGSSHTSCLNEDQRRVCVVWRRVPTADAFHAARWLQRVNDMDALRAAGAAVNYADHLVQPLHFDAGNMQWGNQRSLSLMLDLSSAKCPPLDSLVGALKSYFLAGKTSSRRHMFDYLCDGLAQVWQCCVLPNVRVCNQEQFVLWRNLIDHACDTYDWDKLAVELQPRDWPLFVTELNFAAHGLGPSSAHKGLHTFACMRSPFEVLPSLRGHHVAERDARNDAARAERAQLFLQRSWRIFGQVDNLGQIVACPAYVHSLPTDSKEMLAIMSQAKGPDFARHLQIIRQLADRMAPALEDDYLQSVRGGRGDHAWVRQDPRFALGHHPHQLGLPDPFLSCPLTVFDFQRLGDLIESMLLKPELYSQPTVLGLLRRSCVFVNRDSASGGACFLVKGLNKDGGVTFQVHLKKFFLDDFRVWSEERWGKKNGLLEEFMRTSSAKAFARVPFALRDRYNQQIIEPNSRTYNTFTGCAAWHYAGYNEADWRRSAEFLAFAQHVIFDLCGGDRKYAYIVFHWLAAIIFECKRTNRYLMFCGPQGHGKSKFMSFVTTYLVGKANTITHGQTSNLFGQFQPEEMPTTLLVVAEDSDGLDEADNHRMRTIVASPDTSFNFKHKNAVTHTDNCCNVAILVNKVDEKTFFISNDERRAVVVPCSNTYVTLSPGQQHDYMAEYHDACETNPRVTAIHATNYLSGLDARAFLKDACMLRTDSPLSDAMRIKSMKPVERYLVNVCCGHVTLMDDPYEEPRSVLLYEFESALVKQVGQNHVRMQDVRCFLQNHMDVTFGQQGGADAVFFPHVNVARAALRRSHYKNGGFVPGDYKVKPWACLAGQPPVKYDHENAPTYEQLIAILNELRECKIVNGEVVHPNDPDQQHRPAPVSGRGRRIVIPPEVIAAEPVRMKLKRCSSFDEEQVAAHNEAERARYRAEMADRDDPPPPKPVFDSVLDKAIERMHQREAAAAARLGEYDPVGPMDERGDHELDPVDLVDPDEETSEHSAQSEERRRRGKKSCLYLDDSANESDGESEPGNAGSDGSDDDLVALAEAVDAPKSPPLPKLVYNFMGMDPDEQRRHDEELYQQVSGMNLDMVVNFGDHDAFEQ